MAKSHPDTLKITPAPNTDGRLNWLRRARIELEFQVASQRKFWSILGCLRPSDDVVAYGN
jgi:hypothetical protein